METDRRELEANLLSGILATEGLRTDTQREVLSIPVEVFRQESDHQVLFKACQQLLQETGEVDPIAVENYLQDAGYTTLEGQSTFGYCELLRQRGVLPASITWYYQQLRERLVKERIHRLAHQLADATQQGETLDTIRETATQLQSLVAHDQESWDLEHISDRNSDLLYYLDNPEYFQGQSTGIADVDELVTLHPNRLYVLKAYPSHGKTSLALNWILHRAQDGEAGAVFSLETSGLDLRNMFLSMMTNVPVFERGQRGLSDSEAQRVSDALAAWEKLPLYCTDVTRLTPEMLRAKVQKWKDRAQLQYVVVDYLQKMQVSRPENRRVDLEHISQELKNIAKEYDITMIAISNLSKPRGNKTKQTPPESGQEKGTSNIEYDEDVGITLFNYAHEGVTEVGGEAILDGQTLFRVDKNKLGPIGQTMIFFRKECFKFTGVSYAH